MKNKTLLALLLITVCNLNAQTEKGNEIISLFGNYSKINNESGVTTNLSSSIIKNLGVGASIGFFVADNVIAGIGLNYLSNIEFRQNEIFIEDLIHLEAMDISANMFMPEVYAGYYLKLEKKLYLSNILKTSFGTANASYTSNSVEANAYTPSGYLDISTLAYNRTITSESKYDYFSVSLSPELNYFVTSRFALSLSLGGIEYSLTNWQKASSNWLVSFHPNYWKAGFKFIL